MAANTDSHSFIERYRTGELAPFYRFAPDDIDAALALQRPVDRAALVTALRRQAGRLGAPAAALAAIDRLEHPESRVVVTGQQTGLLLGPLFTLSKAFTAIRLAGTLDSEARPVVPIFWMASQDHDQGEIDHAYLLDFDEILHRVEIELPAAMPSGRMPLDADVVERLRTQLASASFPAAHRAEVFALLERCAERSDTVADWFGAQLYALLGRYGLVVLDPLDPALAVLSADVLRREIEAPAPSVEAVNGAAERLRALGLDPQLGRGQAATNLFFELRESGRSERVALRRERDGFLAGERRLGTSDLLAELAADPTRVTPAAALRPVTQDRMLPTVATVVGPGELRYFAQLRGVYEQHGVDMSLAWPRAEVTLLEPPVQRILARYRLGADDFQRAPAAERDRVLLDLHGYGERFRTRLTSIDEDVAGLIAEVEQIDPTLRGAVERGRDHLQRTVRRLRDVTAAALDRRDDVTRSQFARLHSHLLPLGSPQERVLSPYGPFLKFGIRPVLERFEHLTPEGDHLLEIV